MLFTTQIGASCVIIGLTMLFLCIACVDDADVDYKKTNDRLKIVGGTAFIAAVIGFLIVTMGWIWQ